MKENVENENTKADCRGLFDISFKFTIDVGGEKNCSIGRACERVGDRRGEIAGFFIVMSRFTCHCTVESGAARAAIDRLCSKTHEV